METDLNLTNEIFIKKDGDGFWIGRYFAYIELYRQVKGGPPSYALY